MDGYRYHRGRRAFRDDRDRDIELGLIGFTVRRIADSRVDEDPEGMCDAIASSLRPSS